jgi:serine phosphatase RsbU (regulator of sigma subunit)
MKSPTEILTEFQNKLDTIPDKKRYIREIVEFSTIYGDNYGSGIVTLIEKGLELSKEIGDKVGEVLCYCHLGFVNRTTGQEPSGKNMLSLDELRKMVDEIKHDQEMYAIALNLVSYFHWFRGEYEKAFNLAFESLKLNDGCTVIGKAWNNFGLAVFYFDTKDFENSEKHYQIALDLFAQLDHEYGKARASNGLGTVSIVQNQVEKALPLLEYSATIYRKLGHYAGLSRVATDMGVLEKLGGNYAKAVVHLKESIDLRREINHTQGLITSYSELGETFLLMKEYLQALEQLQCGLELALEIKTQQKEMRLHKLLYDTYKKLKNTELALHHFEKFFEVKSQILSDEAANSIKKVQTQFEKEKSEREAELERFKNEELTRANAIIEQKNKDITDSINYAKRIQMGILPPEGSLDKYLENYFVLYQPKDIVSGDFYWATDARDPGTSNQLSVIAVVDCTGHGVPGAFMSMLGNTLLNQTITQQQVRSAADVLNFLSHKLPENLKSTSEQTIRDGMDIALCIVDKRSMKMQFAGANNPCWIVRKGEIMELKGDKQAISASTDHVKQDFTNQIVELKKNDHVYLFTDGFADQFGGPNEKKFGYRRFKEILLVNAGKTLPQQKSALAAAFEEWKGKLEQVDDVCVIGIRI